MKDIGFLNNLKKEAIKAISGEGKSLLEIKTLCDVAFGLLGNIESKREITSYSSDKKTIISDIELGTDNLKIFKQIINDLQAKAIVHEEDLWTRKGPPLFQDTHTIREIQNGKKMILVNTNVFREYKNELKKIIEDLEHEEKVAISEASHNPKDLLGKRIKVPKTNPVLIYDRTDIIFLNGKKEIILGTITGFSKILLLYFMNNNGINLTEQKIEEDLELFLKNTESRGERSTYTAISKLRAELKNKTKKDFLTRRKDTYGNRWLFNVDLT
jgi:hypothetical protein